MFSHISSSNYHLQARLGLAFFFNQSHKEIALSRLIPSRCLLHFQGAVPAPLLNSSSHLNHQVYVTFKDLFGFCCCCCVCGRVSLCCSSWPGIHRDLTGSAACILVLMAHATTPGNIYFSLLFFFFLNIY